MHRTHGQSHSTFLHTYGLYTWDISRRYLLFTYLAKNQVVTNVYSGNTRGMPTSQKQTTRRILLYLKMYFLLHNSHLRFTKKTFQLEIRFTPTPFTLIKAFRLS